MKICSSCSANKPHDQFYWEAPRYGSPRGRYSSACKSCAKLRSDRQRQSKSTDERRAYDRRYWLKRKYGMTEADWLELLQRAGGGCQICGRTEELVVDHDHHTSDVRGILCRTCNAGIGLLGDDVELLKRAVSYLAEGELS